MSTHDYILSYKDFHDKCEVCIAAKMTRKPFPQVERNSELLEIVHCDICELNVLLTRAGKRYFITFMDDHLHYTYVHLMKTKNEAFDKFKE